MKNLPLVRVKVSGSNWKGLRCEKLDGKLGIFRRRSMSLPGFDITNLSVGVCGRAVGQW